MSNKETIHVQIQENVPVYIHYINQNTLQTTCTLYTLDNTLIWAIFPAVKSLKCQQPYRYEQHHIVAIYIL